MNDSVWSLILSAMKTLGISQKQALYDVSYLNALMYSRATPMYGDGEDGGENKPPFDGAKDACDPGNFADFVKEEEIVRV